MLILGLTLVSGCASNVSEDSQYDYTDESVSEEYTPPPEVTASDVVSVKRTRLGWEQGGDCGGIYDSLFVTFDVTNTSGKVIEAIEFTAEISNEFGDSLKSVSLKTSAAIANGKTKALGSTGTKCFKLNDYVSGDNAILSWSSGDQGQLTLGLNRVKFGDGTTESFYGEEVYEENFTVG